MNAITKIIDQELMQKLAFAANRASSNHALMNYRSRKAERTLLRQDNELRTFEQFLRSCGAVLEERVKPEPPVSAVKPEIWTHISYGLVDAFIQWMKQQGYAIGTINVHLSTIKTYCKIAVRAGIMSPEQFLPIQLIEGLSRKEGVRLDATRNQSRLGSKKAKHNLVPREIIERLKTPIDNSPQARRDALLMAILFDHGLRVSEAAILKIDDFDLEAGMIRFVRPKVDKVQKDRISPDVERLLHQYIVLDAPGAGPLFISTHKNKEMVHIGISTQGVIQRVRFLGRRYGYENLSPHDCRHTWVTYALQDGTPINVLQQAGGWNSPAMLMRYIVAGEVANEGIKLGNKPEKKKRK